MTKRLTNEHLITIVFLGLLIIIFIFSIFYLKDNVDNIILPTLLPTPDYILSIIPTGEIKNIIEGAPTSSLILARGIAISVWENRLGLDIENRDWETVKERASLYIDGIKISNDTLLGGIDGIVGDGIYRFSWAPALTLGVHKATFTFESDTTDLLEYSWYFYVNE